MPTFDQPPPQTAWSATQALLKFLVTPTLLLVAFAGGIAMLGVAQQNHWIESVDSGVPNSSTPLATNTTYICPMMCVPPTTQPGRCPVCDMKLVPATKSSMAGPSSTIEIDARSRRVAGIQTVTAENAMLRREIESVGEIVYDESNMKNLSAYVDGRVEELYADFTGIEVEQGQTLALLYSPDLYSAQVEFVKTLEYDANHRSSNDRVVAANSKLLDSSRQRLIEMGLTTAQVQELEQSKTPKKRLELKAPVSGTVIEKLAVNGQYVKAGTTIYRLADLDKVWLVLELFPEDASSIQIGQRVNATTESLNSLPFEGRVDFISPTVDAKTRTVGIRVVVENPDGKLRPGEFARATLRAPVLPEGQQGQTTVVVPRDSLLSVGKVSVAYVEISPGEFQLRRVTPGPTVNGMTAILEGIHAGENVVARSTFLLDAQMQLQGNPSLIDPDKFANTSESPLLTDAEIEEIRDAFGPLSETDRLLAQEQVICPVTKVRLGTKGMGTPLKVDVDGTPVMICCEGCRSGLLKEPDKFLQLLRDYHSQPSTATPSLNADSIPQMDLPQMDLPQMDLPQMDLPQMDLPTEDD